MKRIISFVLIFALLAPMCAYAASADSDALQAVLLKVKNKIDIPDALSEFESEIANYDDEVYYSFIWHDEEYAKSLSVTSDAEGRIMSVNNYSFDTSDLRVSPVSKEQVIAFADSFVAKALPEIKSELKFDESSYDVSQTLRYSLTYIREKNSVPVKNNTVNISICINDKGELCIRNMTVNIDYNATFAPKSGEIADYESAYKEAFPIELVYRNKYDWENGENKITPELIYRIENEGYIAVENGENIIEDFDMIFDAGSGAVGDSANKNESFTEAELTEISKIDGLLSAEQVTSKVKTLDGIRFPNGVSLESSALYKNNNNEYIYNISYSSGEKAEYSYVRLSAYADSGKLISFTCGGEDYWDDSTLTSAQMKSAEARIEAFLKNVAPEEFASVVKMEIGAQGSVVSANYRRVISGVAHETDGIRIAYSTKKSCITSYYLNFTKADFADPSGVIDADAAYDALLRYAPIEKLYVKSDGKYVECLGLSKYNTVVDAFTGEIKNVKTEEKQEFAYTDIAGHWVEDYAKKLSEMQIGLSGDTLRPSTAISQVDLLRLLSNGIYGKYYNNYSEDELYSTLIQNGIISEEERAPTAAVSREDAFVYIIRFAGLEKIAKLSDIFKVSYPDAKLLSADKIGYCAILSGLGVICGNGGYLRPNECLTRAEALALLYRYLLSA